MNTIVLVGRMGNQMFQYALYLSMLKQGKRVCIDDTSFVDRSYLRDYYNLEYKKAPVPLKKLLLGRNLPSPANVRGHKILVYHDRECGYDEGVFRAKNKYLYGFWQTEKYFPDPEVKSQLREAFRRPKEYLRSEKYREWSDRIKTSASVAVHLRRTDYYCGDNAKVLGNVASDAYYSNAFDYINERVKDPVFYVFSDDKEYAREQYGQRDNYVIVDDDLPDLMEFYLMGECEHRIMANSSFSWWAYWLKEDKSGITCAPEIWFFMRDYKDIHTADMIKIPIQERG